MQLGDILRTAPLHKPVNPRRVSFTVVGEDANLRQIKVPTEAVLIAVPESKREELRVELEAELVKRFPDKQIPASVRRDEELIKVIFLSLRDKDGDDKGYHAPFAEDIVQLRGALVKDEITRLVDEYEKFMEDEFPPQIDTPTWNALVEDAKNSVVDLLTKYGYENVRTVLRSLAAASGK